MKFNIYNRDNFNNCCSSTYKQTVKYVGDLVSATVNVFFIHRHVKLVQKILIRTVLFSTISSNTFIMLLSQLQTEYIQNMTGLCLTLLCSEGQVLVLV